MITSTTHKFRDIAERLQQEIDSKHATRRENTNKQQQQAKSARIEADHLERAQRVLFALAEAHENGTLPGPFKKITSKAQVLDMTKTRLDTSRGYYYIHDTGEFTDTSELAGQLRLWVDDRKSDAERDQEAEQQRRNKIRDMEANLKFADIPGFWPTPAALIDRMFDKVSRFDGTGIILEPSAGIGSLLEAAQAKWPESHSIYVERNYSLCEVLDAKGFEGHRGDFLEHPSVEIADLALMNPPFEQGSDCDHIRHAFEFLKPGGELVAIASASIKFNTRAKFESFRNWLVDNDADVHDLPPDAFNTTDAFKKTGVSTVLVYVRKP